MAKFKYDISIEANSESEAFEKVSVLASLGKKHSSKTLRTVFNKVTARQLDKLAYILENDPATAALALNYIGS